MTMTKRILLLIVLFAVSIKADYLQDTYAPYQFAMHNDGVEKKLPVSTLKQIFKGWLPYWDNGQRIKVYVRPFRDYVQKTMVVNLLGVSPSSFRETVERNYFMEVISIDRMLYEIKTHRGSIGIVESNFVIYNDGFDVVRVHVIEDF